MDMAGNVWEWTRSLWGMDRSKPDYRYYYDPHDGRENLSAPDAAYRTLRGGAFSSNDNHVRCSCRGMSKPDYMDNYVGFRVISPD